MGRTLNAMTANSHSLSSTFSYLSPHVHSHHMIVAGELPQLVAPREPELNTVREEINGRGVQVREEGEEDGFRGRGNVRSYLYGY